MVKCGDLQYILSPYQIVTVHEIKEKRSNILYHGMWFRIHGLMNREVIDMHSSYDNYSKQSEIYIEVRGNTK